VLGWKAGAKKIRHLRDPPVLLVIRCRRHVEQVRIRKVVVSGLGWFARFETAQIVGHRVLHSRPVLNLEIELLE
jgi:hypothetical protein